MIAFKKTDDTQDLVFERNKLGVCYDKIAVKQNCDSAIRQQINELNYSYSKGIDYFNNVFTGTPNYQLFEAQARNQLNNVYGVISVISFDYIIHENLIEYLSLIDTIYGEIQINGQL